MDVALLSSARWRSFRLSKHFVSLALAELGHRALYVDPPVSVGSVVRHPERRTDLVGPRHEAPVPGLEVWHPLALPGQNSAAAQWANGALLKRGITTHFGEPDLTVAFSLEARGVIRRLRGRSVYYCTDSFEDLPDVDAAAIRAREQALIDLVDVVVACSLPLVEQIERRGAPAIYLPHGCDDEAIAPDPIVPTELVGHPRPYVGYVGSVNFRLDPDLLRAALQATEGGTLVLVGGSFGAGPHPAVADLVRQRGVAAISERSPAELPGVMAALDVGLVPYAVSAFNRKSFPIKIPQYLAAGVPVVSTPNGATDHLLGAVRVAEGSRAFADAVREALSDNTTEARSQRIAGVRQRSWRTVATELLAAAGLSAEAAP